MGRAIRYGVVLAALAAVVALWPAPVELPATVYAYLTGETVAAGRDGWGFAPIPLAADAPAAAPAQPPAEP